MSHKGIFLVVFQILAALLGFTSCATSPTGRERINIVPDAQIEELGQQAWIEVKKRYPLSYDQATIDFVNNVAKKVIAAGPLASSKWDVQVFDSKEINAFALPGGHIGVFSGLIPITKNEAGLATVLAHETGHVIAKHANERASDEILTQGALELAKLAIGQGSPLNGPLMAALGLGAQVGVLLPFSRAQESEADHIGLFIMSKAGYSPNEAIRFWDRMMSASPNEPPAFLSDHPASRDRVANLKGLLPQALNEYARSTRHYGLGSRAPASSLSKIIKPNPGN